MIHHSCDRCKRMIDRAEDARHVVRIEVETPLDLSSLEDLEEDRDYLNELNDVLEDLDVDDESLMEMLPQRMQFDLCPDCYRKFISDPLGADTRVPVGFSRN